MKSHVPTIERGKKLKAAGFPQGESLFYWKKCGLGGKIYMGREWEKEGTHWAWKVVNFKTGSNFAAPLASELGEWLPAYAYVWKSSEDNFARWRWDTRSIEIVGGPPNQQGYSDTMPNAMADMAIWLLENGYMP